MFSLNMLRGPIAHCCPLSEDEVDRLRLAVKDWSAPYERITECIGSRAPVRLDADAAELAALYQRAGDAGMEAAMPLWAAAVADARAIRDAFKRDFKVKHMGLKITNEDKPNAQ